VSNISDETHYEETSRRQKFLDINVEDESLRHAGYSRIPEEKRNK